MIDRAGWCYVLTHPAWDGIGLVKIGMTGEVQPPVPLKSHRSADLWHLPCRLVRLGFRSWRR